MKLDLLLEFAVELILRAFAVKNPSNDDQIHQLLRYVKLLLNRFARNPGLHFFRCFCAAGSERANRMETGAEVIGRSSRPRQIKRRHYELAGWEFKPDKQGIRRKRAILRELPGD